MDLVQVKIKGMVITARYGTLNTGDILRTDAEFAKHLVDDCGAADYVTVAGDEQNSAAVDGEQEPAGAAGDEPANADAAVNVDTAAAQPEEAADAAEPGKKRTKKGE